MLGFMGPEGVQVLTGARCRASGLALRGSSGFFGAPRAEPRRGSSSGEPLLGRAVCLGEATWPSASCRSFRSSATAGVLHIPAAYAEPFLRESREVYGVLNEDAHRPNATLGTLPGKVQAYRRGTMYAYRVEGSLAVIFYVEPRATGLIGPLRGDLEDSGLGGFRMCRLRASDFSRLCLACVSKSSFMGPNLL